MFFKAEIKYYNLGYQPTLDRVGMDPPIYKNKSYHNGISINSGLKIRYCLNTFGPYSLFFQI